MQLSVTFRHMEATEALKEYAREKVDRVSKYFADPIKAHVVLTTERGYHHLADVTITLRNGLVIKGQESTEDLYSSIDLVMAKIERQVRKYKERIKSHRPSASQPHATEIQHSVMTVHEPANDGGHDTAPPPATDKPTVIRKSKFFAHPLSVDEAVMQMNLLGNDFLVFTNAVTFEVNVVYRREDATYGLIETGAATKPAAATHNAQPRS